MDLLVKGKLFIEVRCFMHSVEWQKRGLPHVHILLWLTNHVTPDLIDKVISAEIPDPDNDSKLFDIVKSNMIHGPCGTVNLRSPCMKDNTCSKRYPRPLLNETLTGDDGYPKYRRRAPNDGGFTVDINGIKIDNRWVVPLNPVLLRTFNAHINVEFCHSVKSIKYVCKYINKGSDQASFALDNKNDEIKVYENGRYLSSSEAEWRILGYSIHERFPTEVHLAVHLENGQRVYFNPENLSDRVSSPPKTTLLSFFELCQTDNFARTLLYCEVPAYYVWTNKRFERRKRGRAVNDLPGIRKQHALGRVYIVHPNNTECYHIRMLLHEVRGPTSLKTVNGIQYSTFQSACKALGLLENDEHWYAAFEEASLSQSPSRIRELFSIMLVFCQISDPLQLWNSFKENMSEDYLRLLELQQEGNCTGFLREEIFNKCLFEIEEACLGLGGLTLKEYGLLQVNRPLNLENRELARETSYDVISLKEVVNRNQASLTDQQKLAYDQIMQAVEGSKGYIFFLDAPGGTGKTFLINLILAKVRSNRDIALAVASSGIAATLLEGGRTAHSALKLPLNLSNVEKPMCNIPKQSNLAEILRQTKIIIWDESTMAHKRGIEALNRTLQDVRNNKKLMGGITLLLAGDFRQTLPVIPKGTRADEIKACPKKSVLWHIVKILRLTKNMRVHLGGEVSSGVFCYKSETVTLQKLTER